MIKEKELKEYIEPEMRIKRIDFSDILTNSPEGQTNGQGQTTSDWDDPYSGGN